MKLSPGCLLQGKQICLSRMKACSADWEQQVAVPHAMPLQFLETQSSGPPDQPWWLASWTGSKFSAWLEDSSHHGHGVQAGGGWHCRSSSLFLTTLSTLMKASEKSPISSLCPLSSVCWSTPRQLKRCRHPALPCTHSCLSFVEFSIQKLCICGPSNAAFLIASFQHGHVSMFWLFHHGVASSVRLSSKAHTWLKLTLPIAAVLLASDQTHLWSHN